MKKLFCMMVALTVILTLAGCQKKEVETDVTTGSAMTEVIQLTAKGVQPWYTHLEYNTYTPGFNMVLELKGLEVPPAGPQAFSFS